MIPVVIEVETWGQVGVSIRNQRLLMRTAHHSAANHWKKKMLKRHFQHRSAKRYGYAQRSGRYLAKKKALARLGKVEMGGRVDLVYTGLLKRSMDANHRITGGPSQATVQLVGPSYLKINYTPGRPHLANELTTVVVDEREEIADVSAESYADTLDQIRTRKRKKIRA